MSKKTIHKPILIFDETFRQNYWISYGIPWSEYMKSAKKYAYEPRNNQYTAQHGTVKFFKWSHKKTKDEWEITWIWTKKRELAILYHECGHAVFEGLRSVHISVCEETEDVYLYQVDMLVRLTLEKVKK